MAELVYATDLKSVVRYGHVGSTPALGTMKRKHYKAIGIDQDLDAACHSRGSGHNTSRKCKAIKRKTSKRMRQVLRKDMNERLEGCLYNTGADKYV